MFEIDFHVLCMELVSAKQVVTIKNNSVKTTLFSFPIFFSVVLLAVFKQRWNVTECST